MRAAFGEELVQIGSQNEKLVVIDADISKSTCTDKFANTFPARALNVGVAEQDAVGIAAGLATTGLIPLVSTYAVFASMRACEQIRTSVCYPNLNVKVVASHGGIQVGADGVTHQAIEDLSIMRSLPGMTVVHPADALSTRKALRAIMEIRGPVYMRLCRNDVPDIYQENDEFQIGKGRYWRSSSDAEATIIAIGAMVSKALQAADILKELGIPTCVVEIHTLKPLDKEMVLECAKRMKRIVTVEDHNIIGGLGSAVAEVIAEAGLGVPLRRLGLQDVFAESGPPETLMEKYGLGVNQIVAAVQGM